MDQLPLQLVSGAASAALPTCGDRFLDGTPSYGVLAGAKAAQVSGCPTQCTAIAIQRKESES